MLHQKPDNLPSPEPHALAHQQKLLKLIQDEIAASNGQISFARFMELALYAPGLGYYSAGSRKFGAEGDFVTAPEISSLFSKCLARQCEQILKEIPEGKILEYGAGSGIMATDILLELERIDCLPSQYLILEISADLRERQKETITTRCPHLLERVFWLDKLPSEKIDGIVLANEVLDAMPVQGFKITADGIKEVFVAYENGEFVSKLSEPNKQLQEFANTLQKESLQGIGEYESELNLNISPWVKSIGEYLNKGICLLIDYGFPRHEFYHPSRNTGTLMCHYRHHAHSDPFKFVGLQDITAHVDFTAVAESAVECGFNVSGFTTQASFLLSFGITEMMTDPSNQKEYLMQSQQVQTLTMPHEMGELFKLIALSKGIELPLAGFKMQDLIDRL